MKCSEDVNTLYGHINTYFAELFSSGNLTEDQANMTAGIMYIFGDLDRMSDLILEIGSSLKKRRDRNQQFSIEATKDIHQSLEMIENMFADATGILLSGNYENVNTLYDQKEEILDLGIKMRKAHVKRVKLGKCDAHMTEPFNAMIHSIDRMGNVCINIADAIRESDDKPLLPVIVENE